MPEYHAKLSPSGASRWMRCPGSIVLEADYPDSSSTFAEEGTAAHTLASMCLDGGCNATDFFGEKIAVQRDADTVVYYDVTQHMVDHIQTYLDFVREKAAGKTLLVETKVPIGHLTGEEGATGTADAIIVDATGRTLTVIDLKYGMGVVVDADDNEQLRMYALGALEECEMLGDFDMVEVWIHQPRVGNIDGHTLTIGEVLSFEGQVRKAALDVTLAIEAAADPGTDGWDDNYVFPGEKQCKFCRAKATCPALRDEVIDLLGAPATAEEFKSFIADDVDENTGDNWLSVFMAKLPMLEDLCKAVRGEVERRLLAGQTIDGFKLVEGRKGPRQWSDPDAVEEAMKSMRLKSEEMYDRKIISPTTAEKLLKTNPKKWNRLKGQITQTSGKPSVAPATDKRPEISVVATAEDFRALVTSE